MPAESKAKPNIAENIEIELGTDTQPKLRKVVPNHIAVDTIDSSITLIENTGKHIGLLLAEHYSKNGDGIILQNVYHVRTNKAYNTYEKLFRCIYEKINIVRREKLFFVRNENVGVLPLPSEMPYAICKITEQVYEELKRNFNSLDKKRVVEGIETSLKLMSEISNFSLKKAFLNHYYSLKTPKGYADVEGAWKPNSHKSSF